MNDFEGYYMCPNCLTPWKCNGPHINEPDMEGYESAMSEEYFRGYSAGVMEKNNLDIFSRRVSDSEALAWLVMGSGHPETRIRQLRELWMEYTRLGGGYFNRMRQQGAFIQEKEVTE